VPQKRKEMMSPPGLAGTAADELLFTAYTSFMPYDSALQIPVKEGDLLRALDTDIVEGQRLVENTTTNETRWVPTYVMEPPLPRCDGKPPSECRPGQDGFCAADIEDEHGAPKQGYRVMAPEGRGDAVVLVLCNEEQQKLQQLEMDIAGLKKQHDELETAEEQADEGNMPAIGGEKDWDDAPDGACAAPDWGCSDEEDQVQDQDIPEESHQPNFQAAPEADHVPNCAAAAPPQLPSVPKPHSAAWYSKWALSTVEQDAWAPRRPPHAERYTRRLATNPKLQTRIMNDLKARNMGRQLSPHLLTDKWVSELRQEALEIARRIRLDNQPHRHLFDELPPNTAQIFWKIYSKGTKANWWS
jgi:hypothetical protein